MYTRQAHTLIRIGGPPLRTVLLLLLVMRGFSVAFDQGQFFRISGPAASGIVTASRDGRVVWTNAQAGATYAFQTCYPLSVTTNWADYLQLIGSAGINANRVFDPNPPLRMSLIPAGLFTMGDTLDSDPKALPLHTVYVSGFYLDRYDVTQSLWESVHQWGVAHGYGFDNAGQGSGPNYPEQMVNWYDCVKWCNARSEMAGKRPAYYIDLSLSAPYRTGHLLPLVDWHNGYRLPTEAEWEKAARGGLIGFRYPWGDTIDPSLANYNNPDETTTPVDLYPPNGYRLYDMAGNMWQWCWDWYGSYEVGSQTDPRGPLSGTHHVCRGGGMVAAEYGCRVSDRISDSPTFRDNYVGFRSVLPASP
jgi:formylglycine-generating enzyme required for sulfatase activity